MKKLIVILMLAFLASCGKEPPFDPVAKFKEAEEKMQGNKFEEARKAYQEIQEKAPDRSYDADIMLRIADTYYGDEKYAEAQVEYQSFVNFHPVHRDASYAQYQIGMCSLMEMTTIDRDPNLARTALREFGRLLEKYPGNPYESEARKHMASCREHLAQYELYVAKFYYKKEAYPAALGRLDGVMKDYPGSSVERDALYYAGLSSMEWASAEDRPEDVKDKTREQVAAERKARKARALSYFEALVAKFPDMSGKAGPLMTRLRAS